MSGKMSEHTVKAFSEKLEGLSAAIAQMGGLAEAQFANAVDAIARRDTALAENAVGGDKRIDDMQLDIEDRALKLLALRQPMAVDLRETLAAIKIEANWSALATWPRTSPSAPSCSIASRPFGSPHPSPAWASRRSPSSSMYSTPIPTATPRLPRQCGNRTARSTRSTTACFASC